MGMKVICQFSGRIRSGGEDFFNLFFCNFNISETTEARVHFLFDFALL